MVPHAHRDWITCLTMKKTSSTKYHIVSGGNDHAISGWSLNVSQKNSPPVLTSLWIRNEHIYPLIRLTMDVSHLFLYCISNTCKYCFFLILSLKYSTIVSASSDGIMIAWHFEGTRVQKLRQFRIPEVKMGGSVVLIERDAHCLFDSYDSSYASGKFIFILFKNSHRVIEIKDIGFS